MAEIIWLSMDEVCNLTGEIRETVRRKCKRGEYSCTYEKNGKYKNYLINLDSLPEAAKNRYNGIKINVQHSKFYEESPAWAKKQSQKYVELIKKTAGMKHKEIKEFLQDWNLKHPDKKSSYSALCKARIKYEQFGEDALLSKKGFKGDEYRVKPEYYEYYKNLYTKAPSAIDCWMQTLNYAKRKDKIKTANFPCEKTFDRLLKKEYSTEEIKRARKHHEKVIARDYSNIKANEYWIIESCQLKFPLKRGKRYFYPWLTVVKDVKTEKWLGWFIYFEPVNSEHILQAVYYALIKYGRPHKIFIRNMHFDSYIARTGKIKKAEINCDRTKLVRIGIYTNASYSFYIPDNINTTSINFDLKELEFPDPNTSIFDFKEFLDYASICVILFYSLNLLLNFDFDNLSKISINKYLFHFRLPNLFLFHIFYLSNNNILEVYEKLYQIRYQVYMNKKTNNHYTIFPFLHRYQGFLHVGNQLQPNQLFPYQICSYDQRRTYTEISCFRLCLKFKVIKY